MTQKLSPEFEVLVQSALETRDVTADVLQLSGFYHSHPGRPTPWHEKFARPAYVSYFLPLNYARLRAAWHEVERFLPSQAVQAIWDFGSGLGTTHWVLEDSAWAPRPFVCMELSHEAAQFHRDLAQRRQGRWQPQFKQPPRPDPGTLAVFSYSFLEMQHSLPSLQDFEHLLILEPSTRECGRQLMQWRARLLEQGFQALAPCTHNARCPLLLHSGRDWCHQRTIFEAPDWWLKLEEPLPMKNRTLTYSYLLMSRTLSEPEWRGSTRVIGDTLQERGKTRQMVCRGEQREFLSWLHKHGEPPFIPHGALLRGIETCQPKGGEMRAGPESKLEWFD